MHLKLYIISWVEYVEQPPIWERKTFSSIGQREKLILAKQYDCWIKKHRDKQAIWDKVTEDTTPEQSAPHSKKSFG